MTKIYVGNLPETGRRTDLLALFEKYGKVTECDIIKNYGFVHMETEQDAKAAIDGLHEYDFQGSQISVELSRSKVRTKPGMGSEGECYKCGRSGHWSKDCRGPGPMRGRGDGRYGEPPFRSPMPGFRERLYGRYPPDHMRPYPDPYERRPPPPPEREYFRSRSPFGGPRYPPEDYYYRRSPPRRFASDQFMRMDFDGYESRGRLDNDSEELYENSYRLDSLRRGLREESLRREGLRGLRPAGFRDDDLRPGGLREGLRPGGFRDGLRPDGFREEGLRPGGFREDGLRPGGFREEGLRPGGFREEGLRPGGFREEGLRPGGFREEGLRPGGFREEGLRPGGFREDGLRPGLRPGGFGGEGPRPGGFGEEGRRPGGFGEEGRRPGGFGEEQREGLILKDLFRRAGILKGF